MNEKEGYSTSEFPLASALLCMGIKLVEIRPNAEDSARMEFIFNKNELIEKLIAGYWSGSLRVEPKLFWNQAKELKSRIRAQEEIKN